MLPRVIAAVRYLHPENIVEARSLRKGCKACMEVLLEAAILKANSRQLICCYVITTRVYLNFTYREISLSREEASRGSVALLILEQ